MEETRGKVAIVSDRVAALERAIAMKLASGKEPRSWSMTSMPRQSRAAFVADIKASAAPPWPA